MKPLVNILLLIFFLFTYNVALFRWYFPHLRLSRTSENICFTEKVQSDTDSGVICCKMFEQNYVWQYSPCIMMRKLGLLFLSLVLIIAGTS